VGCIIPRTRAPVVTILRDARGSHVILGERRENDALQHIITVTVMMEESGYYDVTPHGS
jgi:hypothetical protein